MARKKKEEGIEQEEEISKSRIYFKLGKQDCYITSDKRQWIWGYDVEQTEKKTGKKYKAFKAEGFYSTLEGLMTAIVDKKARMSDYDSFKDLIKNVQEAKKELSSLYDTAIGSDDVITINKNRVRNA